MKICHLLDFYPSKLCGLLDSIHRLAFFFFNFSFQKRWQMESCFDLKCFCLNSQMSEAGGLVKDLVARVQTDRLKLQSARQSRSGLENVLNANGGSFQA